VSFVDVVITPVPDNATEPVETIVLTVNPAASYQVSAGNAAATISLVDSLSLFDNQLAFYRFNETSGTIANDSANLNNDGTLVNGPTWGNQALSFDGSNDYVQTPVANGSARTLAAWINPISSTTKGCVFDTDIPYQYGSGWGVVNGVVEVILDNRFWYTGVAVSNNVWQHLALAFDATQARLYLNGVLAASLNYTQGDVSAANYRIGASNAGGAHFRGQIRDARIFGIALTDLDASELPSGSLQGPTTAPTNLAANIGSGSVGLSWNASGPAGTRYYISRATSPGGPFVFIGMTTGTSFSDTGLTNGTAYVYSVHSANGSGLSPASTAVTATPAGDLFWTNSAGTGLWNASATNWSGQAWQAWQAGADAIIAQSSNPETITLQGALVADWLRIGNGANHTNYTLLGAAGSSLTATTLHIQGAPSSNLGTNGTTTLTDLNLTVSEDLTIGRVNAVIGGNSIVSANRIGGALGAVTNADWGQLTLQGNVQVTATNGVAGNSTAWGLNLNGGTLTTPSINYGPHAFNGMTNLNFNGTLVRASANNADFITTTGGYDFAPIIQHGGALIDTNGFAIGIGAVLTGTGPLTKSGAGMLTLSAANTFTGATTVTAGTLLQQSSTASSAHTIASGAVLEIANASTVNGPTSSYTGAGTLRKSGTGTLTWPATTATFALSAGALIDVQAGIFTGGSWGNENWSANLSDLHVAAGATFQTVEANVRVNRITGSGTLGTGFNGAGYQNLTIGVNHGSSTFGGSITNTENNAAWVGHLVKQGTGTITLTGSSTYTGNTTVSAGKLVVSGAITSTSAVTIATGAELEISGTLSTSGQLINHGTLVLKDAAQLSAAGGMTNNGIIINSAPGYTLPANLVNNGTIYVLPAAPSGLTATASEGQVSLSWSAMAGASSYVVKQSLSVNGPFIAIAAPTGTSHTATGLTNGTTYFYTVSAVNIAGEGAASSVVSATPTTLLPAPRLTTDIGNVGLAGSATFASGTYTLTGAGTGITGTADGCRFVYQTGSGDCSVTVRVQSLNTTGSGTKVGVMIRESLAANARTAGVWVSPANGILFTRRTSTGGNTSVTASTNKTAPYWVRITRTGNTFRAFLSTNGTSWTQFGNNVNISMSATTSIGIATTSGTINTLCTGVMTNESVTP
jgi:autotransporter-associated beta strand protein